MLDVCWGTAGGELFAFLLVRTRPVSVVQIMVVSLSATILSDVAAQTTIARVGESRQARSCRCGRVSGDAASSTGAKKILNSLVTLLSLTSLLAFLLGRDKAQGRRAWSVRAGLFVRRRLVSFAATVCGKLRLAIL